MEASEVKRNWMYGILLFLAVPLSCILAVQFGSTFLSFEEIVPHLGYLLSWENPDVMDTILWEIRLPRVFYDVIVGAGLSVVGLLMQTVTRNYLADPYILGVSSGASMGAVFAITMGGISLFGGVNTPAFAFLGATLAVVAVISFVGKSSSPVKLVLIGMGISAFFSALTMMMIYSAKHEAQVRSAMFWLLGSLGGIQWTQIPASLLIVGLLIGGVWLFHSDLDLLLLGEEEAAHMGMQVKRFQLIVVILSSLTIGILVATAGIIGFVGLIVPHMARSVCGAKHDTLLYFTTVIGALVMLWADVLSRTLFAPEEIPIGVLTALLGAPLFLWIITKRYEE